MTTSKHTASETSKPEKAPPQPAEPEVELSTEDLEQVAGGARTRGRFA